MSRCRAAQQSRVHLCKKKIVGLFPDCLSDCEYSVCALDRWSTFSQTPNDAYTLWKLSDVRATGRMNENGPRAGCDFPPSPYGLYIACFMHVLYHPIIHEWYGNNVYNRVGYVVGNRHIVWNIHAHLSHCEVLQLYRLAINVSGLLGRFRNV